MNPFPVPASRIRRIFKASGLTQAAFGKRIGVRRETANAYLHARMRPSIKVQKRILRVALANTTARPQPLE